MLRGRDRTHSRGYGNSKRVADELSVTISPFTIPLFNPQPIYARYPL